MQQNKIYRKVGLFVIAGFIFLIGIIFHYVGKNFITDDKNLVVMFFDESIQGLSVGSSVVLQGVEVGQVNKINLIADLQKGTFRTTVYVLFDSKKVFSKQNKDVVNGKNILDNLIEKGLRARLENASILTGQLRIELIMDPSSPIKLYSAGAYREIPTVLSPFAKLSQDLQEIPVHEMLMRAGDLLLDLDETLPRILTNLDSITAKLNKMMDKKSGEFSKTLNNANETMEEISKASRSIKNLTDYLERHPESILRGKEK